MNNQFTRRNTARKIREQAAELAFLRSHPDHPSNGEENDYPGYPRYIANYTKGLPHNDLGEVTPEAYQALLKAVNSGKPEDFEKIPLGCPAKNLSKLPKSEKDDDKPLPLMPCRKFTNPQAGLAFDLEGPDAQSLFIPPAPRIDSAQNSAEMAELYWMALLRDVNFTDFGSNPMVAEAAKSLSTEFSDFRAPKVGGEVTPATIFRGFAPGDLAGPYISQFLLKGNSDKGLNKSEKDGLIRYGTLRIDQRTKTTKPGSDYMTDEQTWKDVQNGVDFSGKDDFDPTPRFIRNFRDLATYVHFDALYEAYLNACIYLLTEMKEKTGQVSMDMRGQGGNKFQFPFDTGNPYRDSLTQIGFGTFGGPHILSLVTEVATRALKAVWFQKWFVHRRLRPEEFGGRIHFHLAKGVDYPIDKEIINSLKGGMLSKYFPGKKGTYLLPQAFPEGSPTHPAYGSGHATVAGACVTILKAWFDESFVIDNPVVPNAQGTALEDYSGKVKLTVGGELNKLASNISIGRNAAGVHWRTDYTESVKLGEAIAIGILEEQKATYNEDHYFTLTKFDGTAIVI